MDKLLRYTGDIGSYSGSGEVHGPYNACQGLHRETKTEPYKLVYSCGNDGDYVHFSQEELEEILTQLKQANKRRRK